MKLSIAVCTYQRADDLERCLAALDAHGCCGTHEVIVVDNSVDAAQRAANEAIARRHRGVTFLRSEPPGLSRARNVALAAATGDVIAYLDDDATVTEGWADAILGAFADREVVCAGGPILAAWPGERPEWLEGELLLSLAVMDRGPADRDLRQDEYFFGANCAFRRRELVAVGGFAEHLGRTGSDLMGDEETEVQRRLRPRGRFRHAGGAPVQHHIRAERCSMQWFLKRYAWQGVSDARTADAGMLSWLATLVSPEALPEGAGALRELLGTNPGTAEEAVARVRFVRGLVAALLEDRVPVARPTEPPTPRRSLDAPEFEAFKAQVPGDTRVLFIELGPAHSYLFGTYGDIPGACLLNPRLDPGVHFDECASFLRNALFYASRSGIRAVVLLTADVLTWPGYEHVLRGREPDARLFGFIHRVPTDARGEESLRALSREADGLFVYTEPTATYLRDQLALEDVHVVPHPPVLLANAAPRLPGDRARAGGRAGVGLLGEVRPGKGYEFAIEAMAAAPSALRERIRVVMAGATDPGSEARLRARCANAGLVADLFLRDRGARGYRAMPDNVFARAVLMSDVVAFPYHDDHRNVFSGHLIDALVAGACFVATAGSALGDIVERNELGETFEAGDARSFVAALDRVLSRRGEGAYGGPARERLVEAHSAAAACRAVQVFLDGADSAAPSLLDPARALRVAGGR